MAADDAFKGTGSRSGNSSSNRDAISDALAGNEFDFDSTSDGRQLNSDSDTNPNTSGVPNSFAVTTGPTIARDDSRTAV
jgi:hypothetical protein